MDPLAGKRQLINDDEISELNYPDLGQGCIVAVGDVFLLRSCCIEIQVVERYKSRNNRIQKWWFRAGFKRYGKSQELWLLPKSSTGDYIKDLHEEGRAMRAQDDPDASTIIGDPLDNPLNLSPPPEPEGVPKDEIKNYRPSMEARQQFLREIAEGRLEESMAPLAERLTRIKELAQTRHVDVSRQLFVMRQSKTPAQVEKHVIAAEKLVADKAA